MNHIVNVEQQVETGQTTSSATLPEWCQKKALVTVREACTLLSCGRTHLYAMIGKGEIISIKLGKSTRIPVVSLAQFLSRLEGI